MPETRDETRIQWVTIARSRLGVLRRFGVYLPPGYEDTKGRFPTLYLLRGHESEWAGRQDGREGLVAVLDRSIEDGVIAPLIVVLPGFMEPSRKSQGIPVNWSAPTGARGVGTGRFEDHFFEVKAFVERRYRAAGGRANAIDGFSMGGYSSVYLAAKYPHVFASAGAYDGSFMWPDQIDPRRRPRGRACRLWHSESTAPFFRNGRGRWQHDKMERHNPLTWLRLAKGQRLRMLRSLRFHVRAAGSESIGNVDRTLNLIAAMERAGVRNSFAGPKLILDRRAQHTWRWADVHIEETLRLHDAALSEVRAAANGKPDAR